MRGTFLIQELEVHPGEARHIILVLQGPAGRIRSAPFWASDQPRIAGLAAGALVELTGMITLWRDRRQLHVETIRRLPPDPGAWERLLPSIGAREPWWALLDRWRTALTAPRLAGILALVFEDPALRTAFSHCPASLAGHHGRLGGLLQHTCEVAQLALAAAPLYPSADPDLLLAGALLHDLGKLDAYRWDGAFRMTAEGHALGHVVLGTLRLDRLLQHSPNPPCTSLERALLHHLLLSHHGALEFGSPVVPITLEAELLSLADRASARADSASQVLNDGSCFEPGGEITTRPVWQLDRRHLWRATSSWGREAPCLATPR